MKKLPSYDVITCALLFLMIVIVLPVSGAETTGVPSVTQKDTISVMVSAANPTVGEPVTISGAVSGGTPVSSVQIWIFAGSYVNVETVPVNSDGTYSKTYQTAGFPPATYYVFVQSPGQDGTFNVRLENTGTYSGQAVDAETGNLLVSFTGTGSVQDAAAAVALSDALNRQNVDDIYAKTTFQLVAPVATPPEGSAVTLAPAVPATMTKSPLSPVMVVVALGLCSIAVATHSRK